MAALTSFTQVKVVTMSPREAGELRTLLVTPHSLALQLTRFAHQATVETGLVEEVCPACWAFSTADGPKRLRPAIYGCGACGHTWASVHFTRYRVRAGERHGLLADRIGVSLDHRGVNVLEAAICQDELLCAMEEVLAA